MGNLKIRKSIDETRVIISNQWDEILFVATPAEAMNLGQELIILSGSMLNEKDKEVKNG